MGIKHHTQTSQPDNPADPVSKDEWNEDHDVTSGSATVTAGNTYVDKTHGLGTTPDENKIKLTSKDDLGGRSVWISNVGNTTFRINISSMDTEDHTFGYVIL